MINHLKHGQPIRKERCETCHFLVVGRRGWFECHRNEPQISIKKECDSAAIDPIAGWPDVMTSDWCGEYVLKKREA